MNDDKLSEKEIDERVIAQVDDEAAWVEVSKKQAERGSREKFLEILSKFRRSNLILQIGSNKCRNEYESVFHSRILISDARNNPLKIDD